MWKKIRKALRRKRLCFKFRLVNSDYSALLGRQVIEVLHELQNRYDFEIANVYLSRFHMSHITIKCDKSDNTDIFADFVSDCGTRIQDCYISRWK